MVLRFCEGFDDRLYPAKWSTPAYTSYTATQVATTYGRLGSIGAVGTWAQSFVPRLDLAVCGIAFSPQDTLNRELLSWRESGTYPAFRLYSTTNTLNLRSLSATSLEASSATTDATFGSTTVGAWYYVEVKVTVRGRPGHIVVRVNDKTVFDAPFNTRNGSTTYQHADGYEALQFGTTPDYIRLDDIYVCDLLGTVNNDFIGDCKIRPITPAAQGFHTALAGNVAGNKWDLVNDIPPNFAEWVASAVDADKESYAMSDLAAGSELVRAVVSRIMAQKSDAGAKSIRQLLRSGGVDNAGSDFAMPSSGWGLNERIMDTNPFTAAAWTRAEVDALEAGVEVRP